MKVKYLYGKYAHLSYLINGKSGIRFSDLSHYSRLENEKMRDDEMNKLFIPRREDIFIEINGMRIPPNDLASDPTISVTPRHCFCLCMSSKCNDIELYQSFKADTCIAFDVDELERRLSIASEKFEGTFIISGDITYYDQKTLNGLGQTAEKLVFYKPDFFSHESEYRIAWFYPLNKSGFLSKGKTIPFRLKNESSHLTFFHLNKTIITDCIIEIYRND
ncbi:hypothetical protein [Citrobacter sp. RHB25-C09]|uniref:hypothetical protein n=1 Tax=Citrobacter sp. RHB25-C09 TaxID=2742624 RepID=UPI0015EEC95D|nr:hypothetical protein [Citrobacter sp. RHB25-C09]QMI04917.1 hypothetical protein HVY19_08610 [Citrobacter sp. RHB25-C09]